MKRESSHWYSLCRKHFKQVYRKTRNGYTALDLDLRKKYRCGFKECRQTPTVEYYPGLADLVAPPPARAVVRARDNRR